MSNVVGDGDDDLDEWNALVKGNTVHAAGSVGGSEQSQAARSLQTQQGTASDSLQRSLQAAEEAKRSGASTLAELNRQRETLERCNRRLDGVDESLNRGERLMRGMGSMWGSVKNWVTPDRSAQTWQPPPSHNPPPTTSNGSSMVFRRTSQPPPKSPTTSTTKSTTSSSAAAGTAPLTTEQDRLLDELGNHCSDLKQMSFQIGSTLSEQDRTLDEVTAKAERANARIEKANRSKLFR